MEIKRAYYGDGTRYFWKHMEFPITASMLEALLLQFPNSRKIVGDSDADGRTTYFQIADNKRHIFWTLDCDGGTMVFMDDGFDPRTELGLKQFIPALLQPSNG